MSDDEPTVAGKIAEFLLHGRDTLRSHGVEDERIGYAAVAGDPAVKWVTVDDVPVFRVVALPDEDEGSRVVAFHGTWVGAARDHVGDQDPWDTGSGAGPDDEETQDDPLAGKLVN